MDVNALIEYLLTPAAQVALIIGIAEVMKKIGFKSKYIPILDLFLGVARGVLVYGGMLGYGIAKGALIGIAIGLSACGLFSGIKNVAEEIR